MCEHWQVLEKDSLLETERRLFTYFFTAADHLRQTIAKMDARLHATHINSWWYFLWYLRATRLSSCCYFLWYLHATRLSWWWYFLWYLRATHISSDRDDIFSDVYVPLVSAHDDIFSDTYTWCDFSIDRTDRYI